MAHKVRDIVIAGGGYVGLTTAVAIKAFAPALRVTLVDRDPPGSPGNDYRASAIAAAARRMLMALDIWPELADDAQPIVDMIVTDSRPQDVMRPIFLTFDGDVSGDEPFAHMISNAALIRALRARAKALKVDLVSGDQVTDFEISPHQVAVHLGSGKKIMSSLLD